MPNLCNNVTRVYGPPEDVEKFFAGFTAETGMCKTYVPMPKAVEETKVGDSNDKPMKSFDDPDGWYGWAVKNWGSKWGDYEGEIIDRGNSKVYAYTTAWSPVGDALRTISRQFPTLGFVTSWEETSAAGFGVFVMLKGEQVVELYCPTEDIPPFSLPDGEWDYDAYQYWVDDRLDEYAKVATYHLGLRGIEVPE